MLLVSSCHTHLSTPAKWDWVWLNKWSRLTHHSTSWCVFCSSWLCTYCCWPLKGLGARPSGLLLSICHPWADFSPLLLTFHTQIWTRKRSDLQIRVGHTQRGHQFTSWSKVICKRLASRFANKQRLTCLFDFAGIVINDWGDRIDTKTRPNEDWQNPKIWFVIDKKQSKCLVSLMSRAHTHTCQSQWPKPIFDVCLLVS